MGENNITPVSTFAAARFLADGTPDPSFGTNGISVLPLKPGSIDNSANGAALQADGKIVISGRLDYEDPVDDYDIRFGVLRLNQDGSLDTTFADNGYFETTESGLAIPIAVQSDGKIVVGGPLNLDPEPSEEPFPEVYDALLIRLNTDGSLDTSFGDGGKTIWAEEGDQMPMNMIIQPDGKIVMHMYISGYYVGSTGGIVRFNQDGTLDPTFGDNGQTRLDYLDDEENNYHFMTNFATMTMQSDGKLIIGGHQRYTVTQPYKFRPTLARLDYNGNPDNSFGTGSIVITDLSPAIVQVQEIITQSNDKILLAGYYYNGDGNFLTIFRYNPDGELDTTWNGTGYLIASTLGEVNEFSQTFGDIQLQSSGKIVAQYTNEYSGPNTGKFSVARFIGEGSINTAPTLTSIGVLSVEARQILQFTATATDIDGNNLTFSLDDGDAGSVPTGAAITVGGEFSWTPSEAQVGQHTFDVVVTDDGEPNLSDSETITVTVTEPPFVNTAPTLTAIGSKTIEAGQTLEFIAMATDPDTIVGQVLTFSLDDGDTGSVPMGAAITPGGEFSWTPSEAQVGEHTFDVVVTDDGEPTLSDFETITVTVTAAPVEPPTELLTNRGFENKTPNNPKRAAKWVTKKLVAGDRRVCNQPNKTPPVVVAYDGKCAFQFKLSTAKARYIEQKVTLTEALEGQTMRVAGYIKRKGLTTGAAIQVQITYADNSKVTLKIAFPSGTKGYKRFENTLLLEHDATKARVRITTGKSKGRLLVDGLSLTVSDEAPLAAGDTPILVPDAPDLRGN